ncbi:MAG TPA: hypothetical protein VI603_08455 [Saprospiraceae bacterium]|nr:hypothetical protein [Saprospiraceae bacterium]
MRFLTIIAAVLFCACGHTQEVVRTFILGDTIVQLVVHRSEKPGPLYYNMHDDENTSVDAAMDIIEDKGGTLFELVHSGNRYIGFSVDSVRYEIDPNRIYTDAGIWRELRRIMVQDSFLMVQEMYTQDTLRLGQVRDSLFSAGDSLLYYALRNQDSGSEVYVIVQDGMLSTRLPLPPLFFDAVDTVVFQMVRAFADSLLSAMQIGSQDLIIALHNNTNNGYCLGSYLVDNIYQDEARATYRGLHPDPDDFYFVTERRIYEQLQPNQYHIILQDNERMTDDGSLSVYCGQRGIHYVNVEAQHKHEKEQKEMLTLLLERLGKN